MFLHGNRIVFVPVCTYCAHTSHHIQLPIADPNAPKFQIWHLETIPESHTFLRKPWFPQMDLWLLVEYHHSNVPYPEYRLILIARLEFLEQYFVTDFFWK